MFQDYSGGSVTQLETLPDTEKSLSLHLVGHDTSTGSELTTSVGRDVLSVSETLPSVSENVLSASVLGPSVKCESNGELHTVSSIFRTSQALMPPKFFHIALAISLSDPQTPLTSPAPFFGLVCQYPMTFADINIQAPSWGLDTLLAG